MFLCWISWIKNSRERTAVQKPKQILQKTADGVISYTRRLTGQELEARLAVFAETYGEILLGMHRDLERQNAALAEHGQEIARQIETAHAIQQETSRRRDEMAETLDAIRREHAAWRNRLSGALALSALALIAAVIALLRSF
jgi:hypothetical protein